MNGIPFMVQLTERGGVLNGQVSKWNASKWVTFELASLSFVGTISSTRKTDPSLDWQFYFILFNIDCKQF